MMEPYVILAVVWGLSLVMAWHSTVIGRTR